MRKKSNSTIIILNEEQQRRMSNLYRKLELHSNTQKNTEPQQKPQDEDKTRVVNLMVNPYLEAA